MTEGPDLADVPTSPPRPARRSMSFLMLAGILAIIGTLAGAYYFAMRPVILRIAVGPANSDDVKLVQALTQGFTQSHGHIRLRPVQTDGAAASAQALAAGKVDLAIVRGDLDVPKNAQAVATLRKNVAVLWVPPVAKAKGRKAGPKITRIAQLAGRRVGVVGRTPANVNLLKVILQQYGIDPAKVEISQYPAGEIADAIKTRRRMPISPPARSTARSPRTRSPPRPTTAARRPSWRSIAPRRLRKTIRITRPPTFPPAPLAGRPTGRTVR